MKTGIELIAQERKEQIEKHGRTIEIDVEENDFGQLNEAAIMLINGFPYQDEDNHTPHGWDVKIWEHMINKPFIERSSIAGALIAANIDRIQAGNNPDASFEPDNETALKNFIESITCYRENTDGTRTFTAFKLCDPDKIQDLYSKIKF